MTSWSVRRSSRRGNANRDFAGMAPGQGNWGRSPGPVWTRRFRAQREARVPVPGLRAQLRHEVLERIDELARGIGDPDRGSGRAGPEIKPPSPRRPTRAGSRARSRSGPFSGAFVLTVGVGSGDEGLAPPQGVAGQTQHADAGEHQA